MARPTSYTPSMITVVLKLADAGGASVAKMCQACGISTFSAFENYRKAYPEFNDAVEICKMARMAAIREKVDESVLEEKKIDFRSAQWSLFNYDREQFPLGEKQADNVVNNIKIGNLNVANINKLSGAELDALISQLETSVTAIQEYQLPKLENQIKPDIEDVVDGDND